MKQLETDNELFPRETLVASPAARLGEILPGEIIIGKIMGLDEQGQPLVDYPQNPSGPPLAAMSTLSITAVHIGRNVALLFAKGDPRSPVIMGLIHSPLHDLIVAYGATSQKPPAREQAASPPLNVDDVAIDGKRLVLEGKEEVVIKCGAASITLTRAGKILIRGNYLLNRASGMNRIMGGSVLVN